MKLFPRLFLLFAIVAVAGCAQLAERAERDDPIMKGIIQTGALEYVHDGNTLDRDSATRVYNHAVDILDHVGDNDTVTVAELRAFIYERVPWDEYSPAEAQRARLFVTFLQGFIADKLEEQAQPVADTVVTVRFVAESVIEVLEPYRRE